jgi:hypothetical protein
MNSNLFRKTALALPVLLLGAQPAAAAALSGTFAHDNDVQFFTFTLGAAGDVNVATTSFTHDNGFVPYLQLWDSTGTYVKDDRPDSADASISLAGLGAGTYYGAVFVWHNYFTGAGGLDFPGAGPGVSFDAVYDPTQFFHRGGLDTNDNFTPAESGCAPGGTTGYFVFDIGGCGNRSGAWALDITGSTVTSGSPYPSSSAVPEPGTLALALAGLAGFAPARRRNA